LKTLKPRIGMYSELRGRHRSKSKSHYGCLQSIVKIASKHDVDPGQLVDALVEAWESTGSHCGSLKIVCRGVSPESATFLITKEENVVWQSQVSLEGIRSPEVLKSHIQDIPIPGPTERERYQKVQQVGNLRFGMKGIDVTAKIIDVPPITPVVTRWGSECYVSNVKIADDTGSIRLSLWNGQVDKVRAGDEVELTNCYVSRFAGQPQLRLRRKSTMSVINHLPREALTQDSTLTVMM
jgi:replication factor A1